jgi:hypothetical protein
MTLSEKVMALYPNLLIEDFVKGTIVLQDDSDGKGAYIAKWEHPTLAKPTSAQLAEIS